MLLLGLLWPGAGAFSALVVTDPTNLVQNTIVAIQSLQTTLNQARQIANEVTMLTNQARQIANQGSMLLNQAKELTQLPLALVQDITSTVQQYTGLLHQAQGLAYNLGQIQAQFQALYPTLAGQGLPSATYATVHAPRWAQQTRAALQEAMQAQSILDRLVKVRSQVEAAVTASQNAVGNLQVSQAGNQLAGIMAQQLAGLEQVLAATGRAQTSLQAEEAMADEAARANAQRLMQGFTNWTPAPVSPTLPRLHY